MCVYVWIRWVKIDLGAKKKVSLVKITSTQGKEAEFVRAKLLMDSKVVTVFTNAKAVHDVGMGYAVGAAGEKYASKAQTATSDRVCGATMLNCVKAGTQQMVQGGYKQDPNTNKRCQGGVHNASVLL